MKDNFSSNVFVNAELFGLFLGGTDSLLNIELQNGFMFQRVNLLESKFKDKLVMADGSVNVSYRFSQLQPLSKESINFICITKKETIPCPLNAFTIEQLNKREIFNGVMDEYMEEQSKYLMKILTILRLYKDGNIGIPSIYYLFEGKYGCTRLVYKTDCSYSNCRNIYDNFYVLEDSECIELNQIIRDSIYLTNLLERPIDRFELGCVEDRDEIAFKELITVNEVLFIGYSSNDNSEFGKKEKLANRLSVWLATNNEELQSIKNDILFFYKYRSEDTHEADSFNITPENRKTLREYTRKSLKKYIERVAYEQKANSNITFKNIKYKIVSELVIKVKEYKLSGLLN